MLHGDNLRRRYEYIANKAQSGTVLEPACGPALFADYWDSGSYAGFDINPTFVKSAQKRGLEVVVGDAYDPESYHESDIVLLCDALHHMGISRETEVIEHSSNAAKKRLIICEPFNDPYLEIISSWGPVRKRLFELWYDHVEKDGNNQVRFKDFRSKIELTDAMLDGFGVIPEHVGRELTTIAGDMLVTYHF